MAITYTYEQPNTAFLSSGYILRATSGGTVFTSIGYNTVAFDYFQDTAVVNDAIYFSAGLYAAPISGLRLYVGTPMASTSHELIWEYYKRNEDGTFDWAEIEDIIDNSNNLTVGGDVIIDFPQQYSSYIKTVGGYGTSHQWIRCRIVSVTGLTEGGANSTKTVKMSYGKVSITGLSSDTLTFNDIYDWIITNKPNIGVIKNDNYYDFRKVGISAIGVPLVTKNEVVELGPGIWGNNSGGLNNLYLKCGTKIDNYHATNGSIFIIHGQPNQGVFSINQTTTEMYGAIIKTGKPFMDLRHLPGYVNLLGEWVDCNIEAACYAPTTSGIATNGVKGCRMNSYLMIVSSDLGVFDRIKYIINTVVLFYLYRSGLTIRDFDYAFAVTGSKYLNYLYQGSDNVSPEWTFVDPITPLGTKSDNPLPLVIATAGDTNLTALKYYNAATKTYTDYTSQASSSTANDIPLGGEVEDYYLFGQSLVFQGGGAGLNVTTSMDNDYEYEWEYCRSGDWYPVNAVYDGTNNLSQSGICAFIVPTATSPAINATTIDGVSAYWIRAKITKKGSTTPYASTIRQFRSGGASFWKLYEKYSVNLKLLDENSNPIEGVNIRYINVYNEEEFNVSTDENGVIEEQVVKSKEFYFSPSETYYYRQILYSDGYAIISKTGYETITLPISTSQKSNLILRMKSSKPILLDSDGKKYVNLDKENIKTDILKLKKI